MEQNVLTNLDILAQLLRLYLVLAVFARYVRNVEDVVGNCPVAVPGVDGILDNTAAELWRSECLARIIRAVEGWRTVYVVPGQRYERFRGPPENARSLPRDDKKHVIYKQCFSKKWVEEADEHSQIYDRAPDLPEGFTILDLAIPDALVPEEDRGWLADQEGEGEGTSA